VNAPPGLLTPLPLAVSVEPRCPPDGIPDIGNIRRHPPSALSFLFGAGRVNPAEMQRKPSHDFSAFSVQNNSPRDHIADAGVHLLSIKEIFGGY
jgi:hypothetical protein